MLGIKSLFLFCYVSGSHFDFVTSTCIASCCTFSYDCVTVIVETIFCHLTFPVLCHPFYGGGRGVLGNWLRVESTTVQKSVDGNTV